MAEPASGAAKVRPMPVVESGRHRASSYDWGRVINPYAAAPVLMAADRRTVRAKDANSKRFVEMHQSIGQFGLASSSTQRPPLAQSRSERSAFLI